MANITTNFLPSKGNWKTVKLPIAATVVMPQGTAIQNPGSDNPYTVVTNATTNCAGILAESIAATDADYGTSGKLKLVWVPKDYTAECDFTVGAGTFVVADIGFNCKFYDGVSLAVDTGGNQATITTYYSATRGRCRLNTDKSAMS